MTRLACSTSARANDINTRDWYAGLDRIDPSTGKPTPRVYKLESSYDPLVRDEDEVIQKIQQAMVRSREWSDRIPLGVFYQNPLVPTFGDRIQARIPDYLQQPPATQQIADDRGISTADISFLLDQLRVS